MECPECSRISALVAQDGTWNCTSCGAEGYLEQDVCPGCGRILPPGELTCTECGASLSFVDNVLARPKDQIASSWLEQARTRAGELKAQESLASNKRMEILRSVDEARLQAEQKAYDTAREKERKFLSIALGLAIVVFLVVILAAVALSR